jgi:hypothetical protein
MTTKHHTRSVSAPAWLNVPTRPVSPSSLPALATLPCASRTHLPLAPLPPVFSAIPGYTNVPATAESSSFALLERRRDDQVAVFRTLPTVARRPWPGRRLAQRRGIEGLRLRLRLGEEGKGMCEGVCCCGAGTL